MDMNEIQKRNNYDQVRVNKDDDLTWIERILGDLWSENKITTDECLCLIDSLYFEE